MSILLIYPRWDEWNMNETVDAVVCGEHLKLLKTENFLMNLNQQASTYMTDDDSLHD